MIHKLPSFSSVLELHEALVIDPDHLEAAPQRQDEAYLIMGRDVGCDHLEVFALAVQKRTQQLRPGR
jgi:hypothetical protein